MLLGGKFLGYILATWESSSRDDAESEIAVVCWYLVKLEKWFGEKIFSITSNRTLGDND